MHHMTIDRYIRLVHEETQGLQLRLLLAKVITWPLPYFVGSRVRASSLRLAGFRIGHGVALWGMPTLIGSGKLQDKLTVGDYVLFNVQCFLDLAAPITLGDHVALGMQTMIITGAHEIGTPECRLGPLAPQPVTIGAGAWLGARCTIMPGVTIGEGAVIAAGSVVTTDVPPHVLVAGIPARVKRQLSGVDTANAVLSQLSKISNGHLLPNQHPATSI